MLLFSAKKSLVTKEQLLKLYTHTGAEDLGYQGQGRHKGKI